MVRLSGTSVRRTIDREAGVGWLACRYWPCGYVELMGRERRERAFWGMGHRIKALIRDYV